MNDLSPTTSTPLGTEDIEIGSGDVDELDESDLEAVAGGVTWHLDSEQPAGAQWGEAKDI